MICKSNHQFVEFSAPTSCRKRYIFHNLPFDFCKISLLSGRAEWVINLNKYSISNVVVHAVLGIAGFFTFTTNLMRGSRSLSFPLHFELRISPQQCFHTSTPQKQQDQHFFDSSPLNIILDSALNVCIYSKFLSKSRDCESGYNTTYFKYSTSSKRIKVLPSSICLICLQYLPTFAYLDARKLNTINISEMPQHPSVLKRMVSCAHCKLLVGTEIVKVLRAK